MRSGAPTVKISLRLARNLPGVSPAARAAIRIGRPKGEVTGRPPTLAGGCRSSAQPARATDRRCVPPFCERLTTSTEAAPAPARTSHSTFFDTGDHCWPQFE